MYLLFSGYQNLDRHIGCDLESAKFILNDLAKFHAVPLALKILEPAIFEENVKKYMDCFQPQEEYVEPPGYDVIFEILEECDECKPFLNKLQKSFELEKDDKFNYREPFATLSHRDLWVNNFMVKLENGKIVKNNFVDFQCFSYESPVRDMIFFLFTSVQLDVIKPNLDYLIKFYHKRFIETLNDHHCLTSNYTFENFLDEIRYYGIFEIVHILGMLIHVVFGEKGGDFPEKGGAEPPPFATKEGTSQEVKQRACWVFKEFQKRKWLGE